MKAFVTGGSGFVGRNLISMLVARGDDARALSRSAAADEAIRAAGGTPVRGDLDEVAAMRRGMAGCDAVFHAAAVVTDWGPIEEFRRVNVEGTRRVLESARAAGVARFVLVSTESVLIGGQPIAGADETWPYPERPFGPYPTTKGEAERLVLAADGAGGMRTNAVRPGMIWGRGDTSVLPQIASAVRSGAWRWVGGGRYRKSTSHVKNVCSALLFVAEHAPGGEAYFVADGAPVDFREFLTALLREGAGLDASRARSVPYGLVYAISAIVEAAWSLARRKGQPPIRRSALHVVGESLTFSDAKLLRLGFTRAITVEQGLAEMKSGRG